MFMWSLLFLSQSGLACMHIHHLPINKNIYIYIKYTNTRLEVPVHDVVEVAVLHARDDLVEEAPRLVRVQLRARSDGMAWDGVKN